MPIIASAAAVTNRALSGPIPWGPLGRVRPAQGRVTAPSIAGMKTVRVSPPLAKIHVDELTRLDTFVAVTFSVKGVAQIADTSRAFKRPLAGNADRERRFEIARCVIDDVADPDIPDVGRARSSCSISISS
jgi:hypothetical protein